MESWKPAMLTIHIPANRQMTTERYVYAMCTAYTFNRHTSLVERGSTTYLAPTYDPDGNQTLVKIGTDIWSVEYDVENRLITFAELGHVYYNY